MRWTIGLTLCVSVWLSASATPGLVDEPSAPACSVAISGSRTVLVGGTTVLTATGIPSGGRFAWTVELPGTSSAPVGRTRRSASYFDAVAVGDTLTLIGRAPCTAPDAAIVRVAYTVGGSTCTAQTRVTCAAGGMTAYRPQHGAGYFPFVRTAVPDADEEDTELGPGIRINNPGDADPAGEDDLIEVELRAFPAGTPFALRRSSGDLAAWTTRDKQAGTELAFMGSSTAALPFAGSELTVWVEWIGAGGGTAALELAPVGGTAAADRLVFHAFGSIVMALGGEDQVPQVPLDPNHGTYVVADDLYRLGYDAHMFDEDAVSPDGSGAVYDAIVDAVQSRAVGEVVAFGYSHGGGSTHDLAERLDMDRAMIGTFSIPLTSYVDGIENDSDADLDMELRFPPSSGYHVNHYQHGTFADFFLDGGPVPGANPPPTGLDVETTVWGANATHFIVDDYNQVKDLIRASLLPRVGR